MIRSLKSAISLLAATLALAALVGAYGVTAAFADEEASSSASSSASASASAPAAEVDKSNIVDPTQRADNSFIYDTSIGSLFSEATLYDARVVQVEGEVIGDRIADTTTEGRTWIMLSSTDTEDVASISVWMSSELADQIDRYGRYGVTGTHFQVRGTYHQACREHEGQSDIHATTASVIAPGSDHPDEFVATDFVYPLFFVALGAVLLYVFRFVRERMR